MKLSERNFELGSGWQVENDNNPFCNRIPPAKTFNNIAVCTQLNILVFPADIYITPSY